LGVSSSKDIAIILKNQQPLYDFLFTADAKCAENILAKRNSFTTIDN
jgi:hypothetical protein